MRLRHRSSPALFLALAIAAWPPAGCGSGESEPAPDAAGPRAESTRAMAEELAMLLDTADLTRNVYLNARRVEAMKASRPPGSGQQALAFDAQLANEHLHAGQTREAIGILEDLLERIHGAPGAFHPETRFELLEMLGLAWLRLGEQENCLLDHTSSSCIVPIDPEGAHTLTEGSRNAIRYFSQLLDERPENLNVRWLLNVAHMTLGEYPDAVPPRWLIPMEGHEPDIGFPAFRDIAPELGLDVVGLAGGSVVDDFTGDGYLDILTSSWHLEDQLRFFVNEGDGTFTERTKEAGLGGITGGLNMVHADYDNDGHPDLFVLRGAWLQDAGRHPNSLLRNNGDGTFVDVTREAGVYSRYPTQTAVWGDFDGDGWVDLFVGNEAGPRASYPSELYLNEGDGTFREVAAGAGVDVRAFVKGVAAGDYDDDGLLDLYVSTLDGPNRLFRNRGADASGMVTFTDVAEQAGVTEPLASFPTWFWDYDGDGRLDLFVSGYRTHPDDVAREYLGMEILGELPRLYRNEGDGTFANTTAEAGLEKVLYTMGSNFGELNNDGNLDFYVGTGDPELRRLMPSRMFLNDGAGGFHEVTLQGRFGNVQKGHGVSFADLNHDGQLDIPMTMGGALEGDAYQNLFLENPGFEGNWLTVRLLGTESNRLAIGARITAVIREDGVRREIHRVVTSGGSFGGNPLRQHLGLGGADSIERLAVIWPASGIVQEFTDVAPNRIVEITEGVDEIVPMAVSSFEYARGRAADEHGPGEAGERTRGGGTGEHAQGGTAEHDHGG